MKTRKKLEEIYEGLKSQFASESDERVILKKKFEKNLEGKNVPKHV